MQATLNVNGSAEYRVAKAIQEEALNRARHWPWASIIADVLVIVGLACLIWGLWR